jgi:hypothetical protein
MGRVARREMILRSKRYPGVDRVVCSILIAIALLVVLQRQRAPSSVLNNSE